MTYIQVPIPDFNFSEVVKRKAKVIVNKYLSVTTIYLNCRTIDGVDSGYNDAIALDLQSFNNKEDKLVYIVEILNLLTEIKQEAKNAPTGLLNIGLIPFGADVSKDEDFLKSLNEIKFHLYNILSGIGYNLDKNAFTDEEVNDLNTKVDLILETLERLKTGQEVIYNHIDELQDDYQSLKSDYPLGKKRWHQRAAGIIVSYAGTKGADEVYEIIKPSLKSLIKHTPELIDRLIN
jgi:hypothetical protein